MSDNLGSGSQTIDCPLDNQEIPFIDLHDSNDQPSNDKRPFQYKPYDASERPFRTRPSEMVSYCLRCGSSDGHRAYSCKAETPNKRGRAFVVFADQKGLYRITDQRPVCIRFNLGQTCGQPSDWHPIHICSLCADANHGASLCPRKWSCTCCHPIQSLCMGTCPSWM